MPLLADIVIASDTALFSDSGHFPGGQVPGDGVHVVFPMLMGMNRGRYFLWTGQVIKADEALRLGLVERGAAQGQGAASAPGSMPKHLAAQPEVLVRHTRNLLVEPIKRAHARIPGPGPLQRVPGADGPSRSPEIT